MNEELEDLREDVEQVEKKDQEEREKVIEKLTNKKIEDKRVFFCFDCSTKKKIKVEALKDYLKGTGIDLAFQAIFTEIINKKIEKDQVFAYTAMRLRQIGNDLNALKKVS